MAEPIGELVWTFPAGNIPAESTGHEPEFTSRDELCLLNTSGEDAEVSISVFYSDRDPVLGYQLTVAAERVCHQRINDLIDPEAVPLGEPYGLVVRSSVPVVAQLSRLDTRAGGLAAAIAAGYTAGGD